MKNNIKIFFYQYNLSKEIFIIVILLSLLLYIPYKYITTDRDTIEGIVIGLNGTSGESGVQPYLIIKLDNNQTITCHVFSSSMYKKDKRVSIVKSNIFGFNTYKFNRYL